MIITRSPLRISLGGGGTDLPSYYREHSGMLISAAIDRYVYITIHQTFEQELNPKGISRACDEITQRIVHALHATVDAVNVRPAEL